MTGRCMPPKRGTPKRTSPQQPPGATYAPRVAAAAAREARAGRLKEPEPEPELAPASKPDPWAALAKVLRNSRSANDETDDDDGDDDDDLFDSSRQRGRRLLVIEAVDSEGMPPHGVARRYHCLWEMNGVVLKYLLRTFHHGISVCKISMCMHTRITLYYTGQVSPAHLGDIG